MLVSVAVFDVAPVSLLALVSTTEAAVLCWTLGIPKLVLLFSDSTNTGILCRHDHPLLQGYYTPHQCSCIGILSLLNISFRGDTDHGRRVVASGYYVSAEQLDIVGVPVSLFALADFAFDSPGIVRSLGTFECIRMHYILEEDYSYLVKRFFV
jgi:hypothetical protein